MGAWPGPRRLDSLGEPVRLRGRTPSILLTGKHTVKTGALSGPRLQRPLLHAAEMSSLRGRGRGGMIEQSFYRDEQEGMRIVQSHRAPLVTPAPAVSVSR